MKVLKYVFLLLILGIVSLAVFLATKKGTYQIVKTKEIELPTHSLFGYLEDYKNWNTWYPSITSEENIQTEGITKGDKATFSFDGLKVQTIGYKYNDSLVQKISDNGVETQSVMKLIPTKKGTKIEWKVKGEMDFMTKVKAFFLGGADSIFGEFYETALNNINHYLTKEITTYSIESVGVVSVPATFYIKQNVTSSIDQLGTKIFESMQTMQKFISENNLTLNGSPFTIFESIDMSQGMVSYYVCQPIKEEIHTSSESDVIGGKIDAHYGYKTILRGDYSHSDKAWEENKAAIAKHKLTEDKTHRQVSIYKTSVLDTHMPSKWVTEIITPTIESYTMPEVENDSLTNVQ